MKPRSLILVALLIVVSCQTAYAQAWEHLYPSSEVNGVSDALWWNGDTAFACGMNWTLLQTTDGGASWEDVFAEEEPLDISKLAKGNGLLFFTAQRSIWNPEDEDSDTTVYVFSYNPVSHNLEDISFTGPQSARSQDVPNEICATDSYLYVPIRYRKSSFNRYDMQAQTWDVLQVQNATYQLSAARENLLVRLRTGFTSQSWVLGVSTDAGYNWTVEELPEISSGTDEQVLHYFQDAEGVRLLYGRAHAVYVSDDTGRTWIEAADNIRELISLVAVSRDEWVVVGKYGDIYKTLDAGGSWITIRPGTNMQTYENTLMRKIISDGDQKLILGNGLGYLTCSSDGGITWDNKRKPLISLIESIHFFDAQRGMMIGRDFEYEPYLHFTLDGAATWIRTGLFSDNYRPRVALYETFDRIATYEITRDSTGMGSFEYYTSTDQGASWELQHVGDVGQYPNLFLPLNNDVFVISTKGSANDAGLYYSDDRGATWTLYPAPEPDFQPRDITCAYDDNGRMVCYMIQYSPRKYAAYKSIDSCKTWSVVFDDQSLGLGSFSRLSLSGPDTVVLHGAWQVVSTYDGGASWNIADIPVVTQSYVPEIIVAFPAMYAVDGPLHVRRTLDNWSTSDVPLVRSMHRYTNIATYKLDNHHIWVACGPEVWRTSDGGSTWVQPAPDVADSFGISSVYPNPVTVGSSVVVDLHLPPQSPLTPRRTGAEGGRRSPVRVSVFDLLGREVALLHEGPVQSAQQTIAWRPGAIPPGQYYIVATSGTARTQRSITVLR